MAAAQLHILCTGAVCVTAGLGMNCVGLHVSVFAAAGQGYIPGIRRADSNVAVSGSSHDAVNCCYITVSVNVAGIGLHGHTAVHLQVIIQEHITLTPGYGVHITLRRHSVRHVEVAVLRNQRRILSGGNLSVMVDDNVLTVRTGCIRRISRF